MYVWNQDCNDDILSGLKLITIKISERTLMIICFQNIKQETIHKSLYACNDSRKVLRRYLGEVARFRVYIYPYRIYAKFISFDWLQY